MIRLHFILLLLLSYSSLFLASGVSKFQIGNDLFNNLFRVVSQKVIAEVNKHKDNLPSLSLDLSPAKFLPLKFNFSNLKYEELAYRDDEIQLSVNNSSKNLKMKLNKVNLKALTDYSEKFLIFNKKGSVYLDLDFSFELDLKFHVTEKNFLQLTFNSVNIEHNFNKLDIKGDFILKLLSKRINIFKKIINWGLKKVLTPVITSLINKLNIILQKQIVVPAFDSSLEIQFLDEPIFTEDYFQLDLGLDFLDNGKKTKFFHNTGEKTFSFKNLNLDLDSEIKDLIQIQLEENVMNDFASVALKNLRHFTITNDSIPKEIPFKVNTLYLQALIPQMYEKYPNKDLIIYLDIESFPFFYLNSAEESLNANLNLGISFALLEDPNNLIFTISTETTVSLKFDSQKEDNTVHLTVNKVEILDVFVILSVFDQISAEKMKEEMNTFFSSFLYFVNNYLRLNPIKTPTVEGISLEKINISVIEDKFLQLKLKPGLI